MKQDRHMKIEVQEVNLASPTQHILTKSEAGNWVLALPPLLRPDQNELEKMLIRLLAGKNSAVHNLELAQQLSLNWCRSQAFKKGLSLEDCWRQSP